jgi:hypothetical protein
MTSFLRVVPRAPSKRLAIAESLAACAVAQAQEQPWYAGARLGYTHDSNVFRQNGVTQSDNIVSAGVLGGFHWRPGRQHLYIDANADNNRYSSLKQLNNTSHAVTTGLDWQTIENLSGSLRYTQRQNLAEYDITTPAERNIARGQDATASIRYGYVSQFGVEAGVSRRESKYSLTTDRDSTSNVGWIGGRYAGGGQLSFGVAARVSKSKTPHFRPLLPLDITIVPVFGPEEPDEGDRKDLDFTTTWQPSDRSTVMGRISITREDHTAPSRADFHGVTGAVNIDYELTGKTKLHGAIIRDTGLESSFLALTQLGLTGLHFENAHTNWIVQLGADWQATAKILAQASVRYLRGSLATVSGADFATNTTRVKLGVSYLPIRNVTLGCNVLRDSGGGVNAANVYG